LIIYEEHMEDKILSTSNILIREVIDLVHRGVFTGKTLPLDVEKLVVINNFDEALELLWTYYEDDEDYLTWKDIRSHEVSEVWKQKYSSKNLDENELSFTGLSEIFYKILVKNTPDKYMEALDDVSSDLANCAFSRNICGKNNDFFERLLKIYDSGYFPCAWKGNYPKGNLIVYGP
jgi:hypothetical protein